MEESSKMHETSMFQQKYDEFVEDLLGALPEYSSSILHAKSLPSEDRVKLFQQDVKLNSVTENGNIEYNTNPKTILPGVSVSDLVWSSLSENTHKAIWEHLRVLTICCFMENGFGGDGENEKPEWMESVMNDMKKKLENVDFEGVFKKIMNIFKSPENTDISGNTEGNFDSAFPKLPEKFLKGHLAKLAEELVKDIKPEDLGMSPELIEECEKSPSRAFDILMQVFSKNPGIIQSTVQKIGKRLQQKIQSGAIKPQEIAREAEELMKDFTSNTAFTELMESLKSTFGFEDLGFARAAGKESSARLAAVKKRLQKKMEQKEKAAASKKPDISVMQTQYNMLSPEEIDKQFPVKIKNSKKK
jgi:hypothetical protein